MYLGLFVFSLLILGISLYILDTVLFLTDDYEIFSPNVVSLFFCLQKISQRAKYVNFAKSHFSLSFLHSKIMPLGLSQEILAQHKAR
jgi:hypothetical protein